MVALNARRPSTAPRSDVIRQGGRDVAIDYLRTSAVVLVGGACEWCARRDSCPAKMLRDGRRVLRTTVHAVVLAKR
ncbi:MAG: hypothetical protein ACYTKD_29715, partial [Planctomycetota bacterium]